SASATALVAVGCVVPSAAAALLKLPVSTTRTKICMPATLSIPECIHAKGHIPTRNKTYPRAGIPSRPAPNHHRVRPNQGAGYGEDEGRDGRGAGAGEGRRDPGLRRAGGRHQPAVRAA